MTLHEPATFLTDGVMAAVATWLAWRLRRRSRVENRAARNWSGTLALTAASALIGGSYHGFAPNFSAPVDAAWWRATLLTVNLLSGAMALSWMHEVVSGKRHRILSTVIAVKFFAFVITGMLHPHFVIALADYGSTLLAWLTAAALLKRAWRGWMLSALVLSFLGGLVQQLHLAPAGWFNHNDLYHVIQTLAIVAFYRAGLHFGSGLIESPKPSLRNQFS